MKTRVTYKKAGVDINKTDGMVTRIKTMCNETKRKEVLGKIGNFSGFFGLPRQNYKDPVLVSATDGVGTKLLIAQMRKNFKTIGIDLVAMSVNDIITCGAEPLFFLDYLSMGKLDNQRATDIITGIARGCKQAKCALLGGETAEMPGFYAHNEYDLAGFTVGVVDNSKIIDGTGIRVGHKLVGIASSGLHSNGYSLVRKVCFEVLNLKIDQHVTELGKTIGEELLTPTKIYAATISALLKDLPIHGIAHITGGGISDNIVRIVPQACSILIREESWDIPPIFSFLQQAGNISAKEMARTFNMGIGMILIVPDYSVVDVVQRIEAMNEHAFVIGEILDCKEAGRRLVWE